MNFPFLTRLFNHDCRVFPSRQIALFVNGGKGILLLKKG
jgi:hypothetical protein